MLGSFSLFKRVYSQLITSHEQREALAVPFFPVTAQPLTFPESWKQQCQILRRNWLLDIFSIRSLTKHGVGAGGERGLLHLRAPAHHLQRWLGPLPVAAWDVQSRLRPHNPHLLDNRTDGRHLRNYRLGHQFHLDSRPFVLQMCRHRTLKVWLLFPEEVVDLPPVRGHFNAKYATGVLSREVWAKRTRSAMGIHFITFA